MDSITAFALSVSDPLVRDIGLLLNDNLVYVAVVLLCLFAAEGRNGKRAKVLFSIAIALLAGLAIKAALAAERPCAGEVWCPTGYSFPSLHALVAFTLAVAFLNKRSYPLFLLFALFVAFTRLNLGVHVFRDVAGALPVAILSYYVTDMAWPGIEKKLRGVLHG